MKQVQLLPIGNVDDGLLNELCPTVEEVLCVPCRVLPIRLDPAFAFHAERQQCNAPEILQCMQGFLTAGSWRMLGIATVDLYIPTLTFVFGEAQMSGPCGVLSAHRLCQDFYGLTADPELLRQRLTKEAVHEFGHTLNLGHCDDYSCVMSSSDDVEQIDLKESSLCAICRSAAKADDAGFLPCGIMEMAACLEGDDVPL